MNASFKSLITIALIFLVFDYIFIFQLGREMWNKQIKLIQKEDAVYRVNGVAALVYILMIAGAYYLVVKKATSSREAALHGALLGAVMYGVFDGTNYVIFKDYSLRTAAIDTLYGTCVTALACYAGYSISH